MEAILNNKLEKINKIIKNLEAISGQVIELKFNQYTLELFLELKDQVHKEKNSIMQEIESNIKKKNKYKKAYHP